MSDNWQFRVEDNVGVITFDRQDREMNVLSESVMRELNDVLDNLAQENMEGLVFVSGKKDFVVGADIDEISRMETAEAVTEASAQLQALFQKIADLKFPTVAAIKGQCLGGGLELALACDWRLTTDDPKTKVGLPEIQLGLIPGAGGTQRLPRLCGIQTALDLILTGKRLNGKRAKRIGLVDAVVPGSLLLSEACSFARRKRRFSNGLPEIPSSGRLSQDLPKWATEGNPIGRKLIQKKAKEMVDEKTKGFYPASYRALDAVFDGYELSLEKGLALEAKIFGELAMTRECASLVHLFHATTRIKKNRFKDSLIEKRGDQRVACAGVIGAGFMGAGIATVCADRSIRVRLSDPNKDSIGNALSSAHGFFKKKLDRRRIKPFELPQRMNQISPGLDTSGFGRCDIVIEAVFEDLGLKQKLLAEVESLGNEDYIFASNTSAIPISKIAETAKDPSRVIGMHFFSPVEKMPLLEVVATDKTADWVIGQTVELGQDMGKQVIVVGDGPGFYTTRALSFFLNEASGILMEGSAIETIDKALTDFGFPVGPITLIDEVGIDVGMHVLETIEASFPDRMKAPKGMQPIAESGRLGRKNSKGFYLYQDGKKLKPDPAVYEILGISKGTSAEPDEIVDRCLLVFVNETARCLEEGILDHPHDGDVGAVFGLGFPPFWGGPFRYVDHLGAKAVVDRLKQLADQYGARFEPSAVLADAAKNGQAFFPDEA